MLEKACFAVAIAATVLGLCVSNAWATFSSATNFGTGAFPSSVDLGDLDGDGFDDIVTSNYNSTRVVVLLNNGNRTFAPAVTYAGSGPYEAKLGLIDGDEHLDLVTTTEGLTAQFRPGLGDGTFGNQSLFEVGGGTSRGLAIGEFNGDSHPDLAVTKFDGANVSIVLGNGDGTFGGPVSYVTGSGSRSVSTGDLNGDTKQDLVVANSNAGNLSVFLGNGDGSFSSLGNLTGAATPYYSSLADMNGDGKTDLAFTNYGGDNVSVRFGAGDGSFLPATNYPVGHLPAGIAGVDIDGDGDIDLATANNDSPGNVSVLSNNGNGTFAPATNYPAGAGPRGIAVGDLDEAPGPDIAAANFLGSEVSVFFNRVPSAQAAPSNPDFGSLDLDQPGEPLTVTLTNALGGDPMTVSGLAVTGTDSSDFTLGDETCTAGPIAYSETCTIELTFTPSAPGSRSADLAVSYNGYVALLSVPLSGVGIPPAPPVTTIDSGPTGMIDSDSATFTFSGTSAAEVEKLQCKLDEEPWSVCTSPHTFESLANGSHTASFRSVDTFGQTDADPPTRSFTVAVPPDTLVDSGPDGNIVVDTATFAFHGTPESGIAKLQCRLDQGDWFDCSSPHTFDGLSNGGHSVSFRAVGLYGQTDPTPASRLFTVSVSPPPPVKATIGKVVVKGPAKAKRGKKTTYRLRITNPGNATATGVRVKVGGKGIKLSRKAGTIAAGATKVVKLKLKAKKPGRIKTSFKVTSANAGTKTVKKTIKVRP